MMGSPRCRRPIALVLVCMCTVALFSLVGCGGEPEEQDADLVVSIALTINAPEASEATRAKVLVGKKEDMRIDDAPVKLHGLLDEGGSASGSQGRSERTNEIPFAEEDLLRFDVAANEASDLEVHSAGTYLIYVAQPPVNADGSSYVAPASALEVVVADGVLRTEARMTIERIAVEDMTKSQLESSASVLIEAGRTQEAKAVLKAAETAPEGIADEGEASELSQRANAQNGPEGQQEGSRSPASAGSAAPEEKGSNTEPAALLQQPVVSSRPSDPSSQAHEHEFAYVLDVPARTEQIYQVEATCDQCNKRFSSVSKFVEHLQRGKKCSSYTPHKTVVGTKTIPEQGHYECSCGKKR